MHVIGLIGFLLLSLDAPADPVFSISAVHTPSAPAIDGVVSDSVWSRASVVTPFIQYEPQRGQPSSVPTRAYLLYDEATLYVAFELSDDIPPTAQLTRRDANLLNDDSVIFVLDSFNDHQSAYYFMVNALGTQTDGRIANDGRTVDPTWDTSWQAAAARTTDGWSVEIAIPFSSIKYDAGDNRTWGINLGRSRRRTLELSFWAGPLNNAFRISQGGSLTGLNVAPPQRRRRTIVYGLARIQQSADDDFNVGGDISYAITPEISAYITVNPDFATIEADQEQINLTRFELSLTEKRPFFLEGTELFRQRIRTFYSRRILDITTGGRVLGKTGPWTLAWLGAAAQPAGETNDAFFGVGRVQRAVGSSNVALSVANRTFAGRQKGSAGLDATLFFTRSLGMTAQLVKSWGEHDSGTWAYFVRPAFDTSIWHFHVRYTHLGENFAEHANAVGFVRDDDRRELDSALERIFWIRGRTFERITYGSNYNVFWSQKGMVRSWQIDESIEAILRNRFCVEGAHREEFKRFEKEFRNRQSTVTLGYNTRAFQSAQLSYRFGRNFDADFQLWSAAGAYKVNPELSLEYELQRLTLDPDPDRNSTWIHVMRVDQFFTRDLFLRMFLQTNSAIDRRNVQAAFVYRYRPPFGTMQLAYQRGTAAFGQRSNQGDTLFLKLTTVF